MKKLCLLITALVLIVSFSSYSITCFAQGGSVTVDGASAEAGEEITVKITASDIKGINSGSIEVKSLPKGVTVTGGEWVVNGQITHFDSSTNRGIFALDGKADLDGTIFELKLKLGADAESGDIVCEVRFKDGSAGNPDVAGVENIPGKLKVLSGDADSTAPNTDGEDADNTDKTSPDTEKDDVNKDDGIGKDPSKDGNDSDVNTDDSGAGADGDGQLSPVVIALIAVAGVALVAAIVLIATKKKK